MRPLISMTLILASAIAGSAWAQPETLTVRGPKNEVLATSFDWTKTKPLSGTVVQGDRGAALRLTNPTGTATTAPVLVIEHPRVGDRYVLFADIRYEGVQGGAYFEMWNVIRDRNTGQVDRYFTRTLSPKGDMGIISGRSGWRLMRLPFNTMGKDVEVLRLELGLHMPASGQVEVGTLTLNGSSDVALAEGVWFSDRTAGLFGGIIGTVFGLGFALIGIFAGRGRARGVVMAALTVLTAMGAGMLALGGVALASAQPAFVVYTLAFSGGLIVLLGVSLRRQIGRRYEAIELRKLDAMDSAP